MKSCKRCLNILMQSLKRKQESFIILMTQLQEIQNKLRRLVRWKTLVSTKHRVHLNKSVKFRRPSQDNLLKVYNNSIMTHWIERMMNLRNLFRSSKSIMLRRKKRFMKLDENLFLFTIILTSSQRHFKIHWMENILKERRVWTSPWMKE